jgi:hypothetical protein
VFWRVEELLRLKMPTVEILASNLLVSAVRINKIDTVRAILANGVEINAFAGLNPPQTAFLKAVERQDVHPLQLLVEAGANPNILSIVGGKTAVEKAVDGGASIEFVQKLVDLGADAKVPLFKYSLLEKLLRQAISEVDFELIRTLLAAKAAAMNPDTLRSAMLQKLANSNEVGLIRALFELSRLFDISADQCQEDLEYLFNGDLKGELNEDFKKEAVSLDLIFERLLESAVDDGFDLAYLLLEAMGKPDGTQVQERTTKHQIPSNSRCLEATLHIVSAGEEQYEVNTTFVQMLLNAGAKVDTPTRTGDTALILATKIGNRQICKILLKRGADVNAAPGRETRMTALQAAAECGQRGLISLFIYANAKINAPGNLVQGRTALQAAAGAAISRQLKI